MGNSPEVLEQFQSAAGPRVRYKHTTSRRMRGRRVGGREQLVAVPTVFPSRRGGRSVQGCVQSLRPIA